MDDVRRKSLDLEVKEADSDAGTVTLYAAVFGNVDRQGEVIEPGAFMNLSEFVKDGWLGLAHDMRALPVATVESAVQDGKGLLLTCRWHGTPHAQQARVTTLERLERGKAVKCSIGYGVREAAPEVRDGKTVMVLKQLELYEASLVNLPANPRAEVVGAKAWWEVFEESRLALKEGRTLSGKNRDRLKRMAERLREAAADMAALLEETNPKEEDDAGNDTEEEVKSAAADPDAGRRLMGDFLSHCATYPTYLLGG